VTAETVGGNPVGAPLDRVEGRDKVTGQARYAYEYPAERVAYAVPVQSTIASGEITRIDGSAALAMPGVLAVLWHQNAPRLAGGTADLRILQGAAVSYRGQIVAAVVAETLETAREAQRRVRVEYRSDDAHIELDPADPGLYRPDRLFPDYPTDTGQGDVDAALAAAEVVLDQTYTTAANHNNPMEPHAAMAEWRDGQLVLHDSSQGASTARDTIAEVLGLPGEQVRVISPHVGGGFGSKGTPRPQTVLAAIAAQVIGRPVKVAFTRQEMWPLTGYRSPTVQRVRLGADSGGRVIAIAHDVVGQTSVVEEFAERAATITRVMYASANRSTTHRLARLNVPTPSWMRAPGEAPGSFALESAMDELAIQCGLDPVELRIRNEPGTDPEQGVPFSTRNLVACLREGAERFDWASRDPAPGIRRDGRWLTGTGVAASTLPARRSASEAIARAEPDGSFAIRIAAADIGTGARTVLTQIAAGTLGVDPGRVRAEIGDSALPFARLAGGSAGTASWSTAVIRACQQLRDQLARHDGAIPPGGLQASVDTREEIGGQPAMSRHAFGAQFVEVKVDPDSREVRVPRMLGVFAAGKIMNAKLARSQLIGGMTWGMSMALHEESVLDREFGDYLNHDLAQYHIPVNADVATIEVHWIEEDDPHLGPAGAKGIGELGIVGTAAAIANAVYHATGIRIRDLPIRIDRLISNPRFTDTQQSSAAKLGR
jgi:xanthine dehydrogenase YagR molybdenum-binding subunit